MAGRTCTPPQRRMVVLMMASVVHVATGTQCPNTTVTSSRVVGAGSLQQMAAQSAEICCGHCVDDAACVAYTFDAKQSMCFLRDNLAQCGFKQEATSGVVHLANRTVKQGGACANEEQRPGYNWPPPSSYGSLWVLLALLVLVIAGGGALLVRNEKRRPDSSLSFPAEQVWHAACFSERSHLPEIVLLAYRLVVLLWALFVLLDSYPNMLFCALSPSTCLQLRRSHVPVTTKVRSYALLRDDGGGQPILFGTSSSWCGTLLWQAVIRCGV